MIKATGHSFKRYVTYGLFMMPILCRGRSAYPVRVRFEPGGGLRGTIRENSNLLDRDAEDACKSYHCLNTCIFWGVETESVCLFSL